jgi:hypothetical protein
VVATAVVNFVAFNVLPLKNIYRQYQQVTSVDFSDIEGMPQSTLDRFRSEDLINPRPAIFEGVGVVGDGGAALTGGSNPAATKVKAAPKQAGAGTGGFYTTFRAEVDAMDKGKRTSSASESESEA